MGSDLLSGIPKGTIMKIIENMDAVLCYVEGNWAWFTTCPLDSQWGDDWNDAPYEHNAGDPYAWKPYYLEREIPLPQYELYRVAWIGPYATPCEDTMNSKFSVQMINQGDIAWLRRTWSGDINVKPIHAGITLKEFIRVMHEAGGEVFLKYIPEEMSDEKTS